MISVRTSINWQQFSGSGSFRGSSNAFLMTSEDEVAAGNLGETRWVSLDLLEETVNREIDISNRNDLSLQSAEGGIQIECDKGVFLDFDTSDCEIWLLWSSIVSCLMDTLFAEKTSTFTIIDTNIDLRLKRSEPGGFDLDLGRQVPAPLRLEFKIDNTLHADGFDLPIALLKGAEQFYGLVRKFSVIEWQELDADLEYLSKIKNKLNQHNVIE